MGGTDDVQPLDHRVWVEIPFWKCVDSMNLFSSRAVSHSISGTTDMVSGLEDCPWLFGIVTSTRFDGIGAARASIRHGARLCSHMMPTAVACPSSLSYTKPRVFFYTFASEHTRGSGAHSFLSVYSRLS
jgi:hypothetical protein